MDDRLEPGCIIFDHVTDTIPPKNKYFIVIAASPDKLALATVYINTDINPNIFTNTRLKNLHIPIYQNDNPFLKWDSYVDCSTIHERPTAAVANCLDSGDTRYGYVSNVDSNTFNKIIDTVKTAFTIQPILKKKYFP